MAELALGLVCLERGALTESLVAEVAHIGPLPGVGPTNVCHLVSDDSDEMSQEKILNVKSPHVAGETRRLEKTFIAHHAEVGALVPVLLLVEYYGIPIRKSETMCILLIN